MGLIDVVLGMEHTERDLVPVKATLLDDDAFRLLAIPFSGPIPSRRNARGVDSDYEYFDERTDIKPDWLKMRAVDWHHGKDPTGVMNPAAYGHLPAATQAPEEGRVTIGKAVDLSMDPEGWWVTVWLDAGERRLSLIRKLAEAGAERGVGLYGSSETVASMMRRGKAGHIDVWPYWRQTLSTSPVNTHSVLAPLKAVLTDAILTDYPATTPAFWRDMAAQMRDLATDLHSNSGGPVSTDSADPGERAAKSGRVLSGINEAAIAEAIEAWTRATDESLTKLREVLERARQGSLPGVSAS